MSIVDVVTISDARANLSRLLAGLDEAGAGAEPVFIGAHRKAEGVLLSVDAYQELVALRSRFERTDAVASAWGSLRAEGLTPTAASARDADDFAAGSIAAEELIDRAIQRHRRPTE